MKQIDSKDKPIRFKRLQSDRRKRKFKSFCCSLYKGRRSTVRRKEEALLPFYTDIYEKWVGILFISIIALSSTDAFLTLKILDKGGKELNPVMDVLLEIDNSVFFLGKFTLTLVCLLFVLVHINFRLLGLVPMRKVLVALFFIYSLLIGYEAVLLSI